MVIVSGFLGAGKTSTILSAVREISERGKKVAIIVNDFGQIGIDAKVMEKYGLEVKELAGGCICCTLGVSLLDTVQRIASAFRPDFIIMEPTGIADPGDILANMERYTGPAPESIKVIHIIDAPRFEVVSRALGTIFAKHMEAADVMVINKIDEANNEQIETIEARLREGGFRGRILRASAERGDGMEEIAEIILMSQSSCK